MAFASMIHDLFPAFSTGRILKFRMDRSKLQRNNAIVGERNEDTILPDDCSLIIQRVPPL